MIHLVAQERRWFLPLEAEHHRSTDFERWWPVLETPGVRWHSLQTEGRAAEFSRLPRVAIEDLSAQLTDFAETAAIIANLDLVKMILKQVGKPESLISFVKDRLGHDRRYAIDSSFAQKELKWKPRTDFKEGLEATIQWYIDNQSWWQPLLERAGRY